MTAVTGDFLKKMRLKYGLSHVELATALNIKPSTLESYEQGRRAVPERYTQKLIKNLITTTQDTSRGLNKNNMIRGTSLKQCRHMLGMDVETIAQEFACSPHTWRSYEQGRRLLPEIIKNKLESRLLESYQKMFNS